MPNYNSLFSQGIYSLRDNVRVFAGTVDDPFYIDLGAAFDSLNFRMGVGGVLSPQVDADDTHNYAPDSVAGFNVNTIVLEVPITMLTADGKLHGAGEKEAVIGTYGCHFASQSYGSASHGPLTQSNFAQVNREGNSLINELIIGTGSKDKFSTDDPKNDGQFAAFFLDPLLAHLFAGLGIPVPPAPRLDLLPLVSLHGSDLPGMRTERRGTDRGPASAEHRHSADTGGTAEATGLPGRRQCRIPERTSTRSTMWWTSPLARLRGILADPVKYGTRIGDGVNINDNGYLRRSRT